MLLFAPGDAIQTDQFCCQKVSQILDGMILEAQ